MWGEDDGRLQSVLCMIYILSTINFYFNTRDFSNFDSITFKRVRLLLALWLFSSVQIWIWDPGDTEITALWQQFCYWAQWVQVKNLVLPGKAIIFARWEYLVCSELQQLPRCYEIRPSVSFPFQVFSSQKGWPQAKIELARFDKMSRKNLSLIHLINHTQHGNLSWTKFSSRTNFYVVKMLTCAGFHYTILFSIYAPFRFTSACQHLNPIPPAWKTRNYSQGWQ